MDIYELTREKIEERITEAFLGFQQGKSREAMITLLANDIEQWLSEIAFFSSHSLPHDPSGQTPSH